MTYKQKLIATQVYLHFIFILGLALIPWYVTVPTLLLSQIVYVGLCGTVLFHRTISHKNAIHPIFEKVLLMLSWMGAVSSALAWSGVHRKHHRYSDTAKDPHSPKIMGRFRAYWQLSDNDKDIIKYVPDLLKKPIYVFQHKYYFQVLHSIHVIGLIFLPLEWYWMLMVVPGVLMWMGGSLVNIFCHDNKGPTNNIILGFLNAGEGWHKNHHDQPGNPSFRHWADWGGHSHHLLSIK